MHEKLGGRRLMLLGAVLFMLGLLTGFVIPALENPRMGLTSHLEGVMNGTFLIAVGLVWPHLRIGPGAAGVAFICFSFGTYVNWLSTLLAGIWGTGRITPIAAPGMEGEAWQEAIVSAGLIAISLAMVVGTAVLIYGLRGAPATTTGGAAT